MTTSNKRRARITIVNAGWWGTQAHLPSLTQYQDVEVVSIADLDPDKLDAAGRVYGVEHCYPDFRHMLDVEKPDGVVAATNHTSHYLVARTVPTP